MEYGIKQVSEITNISKSQIRYYEKEGLLPSFKRDKNNIRVFTEEDIELINLVKCLRRIGMPLKVVRENINLLLDKNSGLTTSDILLEHKYKLKSHIEVLEKYIYEIDLKLDKDYK